MASSALPWFAVVASTIPLVAGQAYCCIGGQCEYKDPLEPGVPCFGTQDMCSEQCAGPQPHQCWGCQETCTPCPCEGVCPGSGDYPFWDKSECEARCGGEAYTWLCTYGCQTEQQCFTLAQCTEGTSTHSPCDPERAKQSCGGTLLTKTIPKSYPPSQASQCAMQARANIAGNVGCSSAGNATVAELEPSQSPTKEESKLADDDDPCNPDPDGSKHACFNDCFECYEEGFDKWCLPPASGGFGCNTGHDCQVLIDETSCKIPCGCRVAPPVPGQCPRPQSDQFWGQCRDPAKGGGPQCIWCQKDHTCEPTHGKHFPLPYDPSCGPPPPGLVESAGPAEAQESMQHLCTFACDDGTSEFVCLIDPCPESYDGCQRADSYQVSSNGCNTLTTYFYSAGGQKVTDRVSAHTSVAGSAMHEAALAAIAARQLAGARGDPPLGDVTADEIASGVRALEDKGLQVAEKALCQWSLEGDANRFCGFLVGTPVVQWVNDKILNLPVVAQVTHQIATLAEGAAKAVADVVNSAVAAVAKAATAAKNVVNTCINAANDIVHSVLNFFSWMEHSVFAAVTGKLRRVPLAPPHLLV